MSVWPSAAAWGPVQGPGVPLERWGTAWAAHLCQLTTLAGVPVRAEESFLLVQPGTRMFLPNTMQTSV